MIRSLLPLNPAAHLLRWHFGSEAGHAGMRAQDISADRGGDGFDERMLRRSLNGHQDAHRRVRQALGKLAPEQRNILELAYGLTFRNRDVETESKRRALRTEERNWRVRLRERFDYLECAAVLASPLAMRLSGASDELGLIGWLLEADQEMRSRVTANVQSLLTEALKAFAHVYVPPKDKPRLDAVTPRKRNFSRTRARILASHPEHGQEIGR